MLNIDDALDLLKNQTEAYPMPFKVNFKSDPDSDGTQTILVEIDGNRFARIGEWYFHEAILSVVAYCIASATLIYGEGIQKGNAVTIEQIKQLKEMMEDHNEGEANI